jgi:hypothetical protein
MSTSSEKKQLFRSEKCKLNGYTYTAKIIVWFIWFLYYGFLHFSQNYECLSKIYRNRNNGLGIFDFLQKKSSRYLETFPRKMQKTYVRCCNCRGFSKTIKDRDMRFFAKDQEFLPPGLRRSVKRYLLKSLTKNMIFTLWFFVFT